MKPVDKQIPHAVCIVNAPLKLMLGVLIRHGTYHSSRAYMGEQRWPGQQVAVRGRRQGDEWQLMRRIVVGVGVWSCIGGNMAAHGGWAWW